MTKERPILFNEPMVRALLDGSKTKTRRACMLEVRSGMPEPEWSSLLRRCHYGQPGDRLWVKETHWVDDEDGAILYAANADEFSLVNQNKHESGLPRYNWKPSIFMLRIYSRITLEITSVRVERLQDITRGDCMAEGCPFPNIASKTDPVRWYRDLWESINGPGSWGQNPWVWVIEFKKVQP